MVGLYTAVPVLISVSPISMQDRTLASISARTSNAGRRFRSMNASARLRKHQYSIANQSHDFPRGLGRWLESCSFRFSSVFAWPDAMRSRAERLSAGLTGPICNCCQWLIPDSGAHYKIRIGRQIELCSVCGTRTK